MDVTRRDTPTRVLGILTVGQKSPRVVPHLLKVQVASSLDGGRAGGKVAGVRGQGRGRGHSADVGVSGGHEVGRPGGGHVCGRVVGGGGAAADELVALVGRRSG